MGHLALLGISLRLRSHRIPVSQRRGGSVFKFVLHRSLLCWNLIKPPLCVPRLVVRTRFNSRKVVVPHDEVMISRT